LQNSFKQFKINPDSEVFSVQPKIKKSWKYKKIFLINKLERYTNYKNNSIIQFLKIFFRTNVIFFLYLSYKFYIDIVININTINSEFIDNNKNYDI